MRSGTTPWDIFLYTPANDRQKSRFFYAATITWCSMLGPLHTVIVFLPNEIMPSSVFTISPAENSNLLNPLLLLLVFSSAKPLFPLINGLHHFHSSVFHCTFSLSIVSRLCMYCSLLRVDFYHSLSYLLTIDNLLL